jgi:hypothetical protein
MKEDKQIATRFFASKNLEARPFSKTKGKSPDFELYLKDDFFAYCELKSITKYEWSGLRDPPIWNNIQNKIHEARKQFTDVNPNHNMPNILIIINYDDHYNWQDLYKVLFGKEPIAELPAYDTRHLKRLIRDGGLFETDFIIWLDLIGTDIKPFQTVNAQSRFKNKLKRQMINKK